MLCENCDEKSVNGCSAQQTAANKTAQRFRYIDYSISTCVKCNIDAMTTKPPQTQANLTPLSTGVTNSSIKTSTSAMYTKVPEANAVKPSGRYIQN
jgi:hypothetical protein